MHSFSTIDVCIACQLGKNQKIIKSLELLLEICTRMFRMYKFCLSGRVYHTRLITVNFPRMAQYTDNPSSLHTPISFSSLSTEGQLPENCVCDAWKNSGFSISPFDYQIFIQYQIHSPHGWNSIHTEFKKQFTTRLLLPYTF